MFGEDDDSAPPSSSSYYYDDDDDDSNRRASFFGEVRSMPVSAVGVGGNRGVFARTPLAPGSLVAAETPWLLWDDNNNDFTDTDVLASAVRHLLIQSPVRLASRRLHPRSLDDVPADETARMTDLLGDATIADIGRSVSPAAPAAEVVRVALALQHNAFCSGLYVALALFNHSCRPNCIKLTPKNRFSPSEIWTTRPVGADEELTICYCSPLETPRRRIRQYLLEHHRFECRCELCVHQATDDDDDDDDDEVYVEMVAMERELIAQAVDKPSSIALQSKRMYRRAISVGLGATSKRTRARLLGLAAAAAEASIEAHRCGGRPTPLECVSAFFRCVCCRLENQMAYLGADHPDVGASLLDAEMGLRGLAADFPTQIPSALKLLAGVWPAGGTAVDDLELWLVALAREGRRVKRLYAAARFPGAAHIYGKAGRDFWGADGE